MSPFARPCPTCGARVEPGGVCPRCGGQRRASSCRECGARTDGSPYCAAHVHLVSEAARVARQPWRMAYRDPTYYKHRAQRYKLAGGRCEGCGIPVVKGEWEAHHVVALTDGGTNEVENLRVLCTLPRFGAAHGCHGLVTARARRERD